MKFVECLKQKTQDNYTNRTPVIAFLGDSVTQGCFEIWSENGRICTEFDSREAYSEKVKRILATLYPKSPICTANFGINGDDAPSGARRFAKDVLATNPDLLIVCYGLNDSSKQMEGISEYKEGLKSIFRQAKDAGIETIFMTPNMINTYTDKRRLEEFFYPLADGAAKGQLEGMFDAYMDAAREVCKEENIRLCDCYAIWKHLYESGVDTTALLSNCINHPTREMHYLFAWELVRCILT